MKQTEKLDLLLKGLYEFRFDEKYYDIEEILSNVGVPINNAEARLLGRRLEQEGLIKYLPTQDAARATLTSEGAEYAESDSYTYQGQAVINNNYNITITNSPGSNVVSNSQNVNISTQIHTLTSLIDQIISLVEKDDSISLNRKEDIRSFALEISNNLKSGHVPKFGITNFLSVISDISSVASLALAIGQAL